MELFGFRRTVLPYLLPGTNWSQSRKMVIQGDIFTNVANGLPPPQIPTRNDHPVPQKGIAASRAPIGTNKFYANLFLDNQDETVWTHPYSLQWNHGAGPTQSWGMGITHVDRKLTAYGEGNPCRYFLNPIGIRSMILSARELGPSTALTTDSHLGFSVNANLSPRAGTQPVLTLPLVQGMGFVTGIFNNCMPLIQSHVLFRSLNAVPAPRSCFKFSAILEDGNEWLIYVITDQSTVSLTLESNNTVCGPNGFSGMIQVAKVSGGSADNNVYDASAGTYPTQGQISANTSGTYQLSWTKAGITSKPLLMFGLPHHIMSFSGSMTTAITSVQLQTTTKGIATAVQADQWNMFEKLPTDMGFAPWSPSRRSVTKLPAATISLMNQVAALELEQDIDAQTNLDSMYFSGKGLAKFAMIIYAINDLAQNSRLAAAGLAKLKAAFQVFVNNKQKCPLVYDKVWRGMVSTAGWTDPNMDFGNTLYNDHHFHYGYFVYTAAVIGYLDPSWLTQGTNQAWVNSLVRDFANPVSGDYFPFSRSFDWYHGHSWAKGLFASGDGKDQESTSEDSFASYGLKMWGKVTKDARMEARGNLMLAIQARTFQCYFLMDSNNMCQPSQFIGNKVTGILFENKASLPSQLTEAQADGQQCDHATYFGLNPEYIQGIHMIPIAPPSAYIRPSNFVSEEWAVYFDKGRVDQVAGGWCGLLYANLTLVDPKASYAFFSSDRFDYGCLDGGASRTWYLAYTAALGGL